METERGLRRRVFLCLEMLTSRLATEVVANSRSLATKALELRSTAGSPVVVIGEGSGLGVDLEYYSKVAPVAGVDKDTSDFLRDNRCLVIGYVGRIHPDKGIDTLIEAALALSKQRTGVKLMLIGDQDGAELEALLQRCAPSLDVHVVGSVEDVRPYYKAMDIHCLPTLREGFPNVVLEASAMEIPTVTTDATGAVDSVVDGKTGYIFPVGDSHALTAILMRLYDEPELRLRLGVSARQFVERHYSRLVLWRLHERHLRAQLLAVEDRSTTIEGEAL